MQQRCNRGATEVQQRCNNGATTVILAKVPCALNCGGGGGGVVGGGGVGQMPSKHAQIARMEEVGRARGVRVKTTRVETGRDRQRDRSRQAAGPPPVTPSTPLQQRPRAAAQAPPRCGSAAPFGRGTARAGGSSLEAVLPGAEARAPAAAACNSAPGPAAWVGSRGRRGGHGRGVRAEGTGGGGGTVGGLREWLTRGKQRGSGQRT